ncbi:MAG: triose-phosphate isomerase [Hyphomicrobiales bacterium]
MRDFLIAGNWKMNGSTASNAELTSGIVEGLPTAANVILLICPPFPYLASAAAQIAGSRLRLGAQNVSEQAPGALTGETAAVMLKDIGCEYVIVGHSERRAIMGESSEMVAAKFCAAQAAGLTPILCVGETLNERQAEQTKEVVSAQLAAVIDAAGIDALANAVIAYEPVWAIGTGLTATPEQAQDVHQHIRADVAARNEAVAAGVQILYGGSVKGDNAAGLLSMPDIDGGLIGGASLDAAGFLAIAEAAVALN